MLSSQHPPQFASQVFFFFLMVTMISTSHAVPLLDFALKHQLAQISWVKKLVWKVWVCVRVRVWLIIIIIINIFGEGVVVCHSALEVTCMGKESGVWIGKLHEQIQNKRLYFHTHTQINLKLIVYSVRFSQFCCTFLISISYQEKSLYNNVQVIVVVIFCFFSMFYLSVLCCMFHALRPKAGTSWTPEEFLVRGQLVCNIQYT